MYYIRKNLGSSDKQSISNGTQILISKELDLTILTDTEGPFDSIPELKSNSKIFKELASFDSKRVNKILNPKNIKEIKDIIFTNLNNKISLDFAHAFKHIAYGEIKSDQLKGLHFYNSNVMSIISETQPDKNGVWLGKIEFKNTKPTKNLEKQSSFFPKSWNLSRLFHECQFAISNMRKDTDRKEIFVSVASCGIPVEIVIRKERFITIYPIIYEGKQE